MSSGRQVLSIVGQIAGAAFGPIGSVIGGFIGGELGGAIDGPPEGPRLDDTSAPTLEFGSKVPRLYGRVWCTLSPRWWSGLRESSETVGGKGADSGQEQFSYRADLLGVLGEVDLARWPTPVWTRIRIDGEIVATRLAASSAGSLAISAETERYSDVELFTGAAAQAPWSVMEAAVGATNAVAYRGMVSIGFTNLLMQNGRRPSLIEVEISTAATLGTVTALTRLQSYFDTNTTDISAYANGGGTITGTNGSVSGGFLNVNSADSSNGYFVTYSGTPFGGGDGTSAVTVELFADWVQGPNTTGQVFFSYNCVTGIRRLAFGGGGQVIYNDAGFGVEYEGPAGEALGRHHYAMVFSAPGFRFYFDGDLRYATGGDARFSGAADVQVGGVGYTGLAALICSIDSFRVRHEEVYTANFTPPAELPPPDGSLTTYTPLAADLRAVLESEMLRCRPLVAGNIEMSAAAGRNVHGFKAADSAAAACATLLNWFYLDLYCADRIVCVLRGGAVEQSIAYGYTGSAIDGTSDPFAGLVRENDVERQVATTVSYININADGETDTQMGDRIGAGSEIAQANFPIYAIASEAKGRANTITHDARVAAHTATVRLGATHAARVQPGSVLTLTDNKGNSYRVRVLRLVWNRGVYDVDVVLDDPNILTTVGITTTVDTQVINLVAPAEAAFLPLDLPMLLPADDDPGYLGLVRTDESATGARWFDSPDNVTYTARADYANDATFGTVTAGSGTFARGVLFDEGSSLTVNLGLDAAPSSTTRAALLASRELNAFAVGINGRMVLGQFRTATALGAGSWRFTSFVNMGAKGTEQYCDNIVTGDKFALLGTSGTARMPRTLAQLGTAFHTKAVSIGRALSGVTAQAFTANGVSLKPLSPVRLRAARDAATGDIALTWARRTRSDTRFGGALGDACPLGETSEQYRARLYTSNTYATLLRDLGVVTAASVPYTAAQRTADGLSLYAPLYVDVRQLSDVIGEGYALQESA